MKYKLTNIKDFNLDHIFDCGQCFRWEKAEDGSYTGIVGSQIANVQFESGDLIITTTAEEECRSFWHDYLDLERSYGEIKKNLVKRDPVISQSINHGHGIRILQQDPWETLISFIISQNSNIPRIKKCIQTLCENFGEQIGTYQGKTYFSFPAPEIIAELTVEDLAVCRLGYRAKYLIQTAKQVTGDGREKLQGMKHPDVSEEEAFSYINSFAGVGPKVANCVLLFSLGKYESFPVDVWVKKVMKELYGIENEKEIRTFAKETFGAYGGMAQQYLFYYMREKE